MPLPVLHSFAGYSIYKTAKKRESVLNWKWAILFIVLANAPDFDFLPGILSGDADRFHRGISHSLGAAVAVGLSIGFLYVVRSNLRTAKKIALWSGFAYFSHALLDLLNGPVHSIPLFWPLSSAGFSVPIAFIPTGDAASMHQATGLRDFTFALLHPAFANQFFFELSVVFLIWSISTMLSVVKGRRRWAVIRYEQE